MGAALITLCAWISVPTTIPFTLQTFAICLVAALFGLRTGFWTVAVYLLLGAVGAPVFAGFRGGIAALLGTTGGYLLGFLFTAAAVGLAVDKLGRKPPVLIGMLTAGSYRDSMKRYADNMIKQADALRPLARRVEASRAEQDALSYAFAEQLMTDKIGSEQLAEGEAQYEEGLESYNEGKAKYDAGNARLQGAVSEYNAGAAKLAQGQAEYDAGVAQYNEGKARLEAGSAQLAQGQAEYDAALARYNEGKARYDAAQAELAQGQAEYDAGLAKYNEGKARLDAVTPLYQSALALHNRVVELQAQYDHAVSSS